MGSVNNLIYYKIQISLRSVNQMEECEDAPSSLGGHPPVIGQIGWLILAHRIHFLGWAIL